MANELKGYLVSAGYIGFVDGKKMLFATEDDYEEHMREIECSANKKGDQVNENWGQVLSMDV